MSILKTDFNIQYKTWTINLIEIMKPLNKIFLSTFHHYRLLLFIYFCELLSLPLKLSWSYQRERGIFIATQIFPKKKITSKTSKQCKKEMLEHKPKHWLEAANSHWEDRRRGTKSENMRSPGLGKLCLLCCFSSSNFLT